jgi:hypothetical protein
MIMISQAQAQAMYEYYEQLISKLTEAKLALISGGVKSYTINDRSLTRFDVESLTAEIDDAVNKRAEYDAIRNGRAPRKAFGIIPRDW